jgi:hypothetical protein
MDCVLQTVMAPDADSDNLAVEHDVASQELATEPVLEMNEQLRDNEIAVPRPFTCSRCTRRFATLKEKKNHTR